jgi:mRNA-degrading endonuclease RelE of RelBE toxin-antitoxin system
MDKLAKLLKKLSAKERTQLLAVLTSLAEGDAASLDIKKLKGVDHIFRIRVGSLRVIFAKDKGEIRLLEVSRRSERTYENL